MSIPNVSFIGFEPEQRKKAMDTLSEVIRLKDKNRAAAEESYGYELQEDERYARKSKPLVDAIEKASENYIAYRGENDIKVVAKELLEASQLMRQSNAELKKDPGNVGLQDLTKAYILQMAYAATKLEYLNAAEALSTAPEDKIGEVVGELEKARDKYAEVLEMFQSVTLPIGFRSVVKVLSPPPKGSVFPGANMQIPTEGILGLSEFAEQPPKQEPKLSSPPAPLPKAPSLKMPPKSSETSTSPMEYTEIPTDEPTTMKKVKKPQSGQVYQSAPKSFMDTPVALVNVSRFEDTFPPWVRAEGNKGYGEPGTIALVKMPPPAPRSRGKPDPVELEVTHPALGTKKTVYLGGDRDISIYSDKELRQDIGANKAGKILKLLAITPLPLPLKKTDIADIIQFHIRTFGGWGKIAWNMSPQDEYPNTPLMKNITADREMYEEAVKQTAEKGDITKRKVGSDKRYKAVGFGVRPKPSMMRMTSDGQYGNLMIDVKAFYNDGQLVAHENGKVVLNEPMTPGIKNMVIKRVMQTTIDKAKPETQKQLKKLRKLAGFLPSKSSGSSKGSGVKAKSNVVVVGSPADILKRMKIACGVFDAGNRSKENANLISELASKLMQLGAVTEEEYGKILSKYKA